MFVVTGVTGNTGSVVAKGLLEAGKKVRVVVRDAAKGQPFAAKGAEVAVADLSDAGALEQALRGAEGVYLLSPPDAKTEHFLADKAALAEVFARAVKGAKVPHVVLLSSVGAQHATGTGVIRSLHGAEAALAATGAATTFVRAAYFAENWGSVLPVAKKDGVLPTFLPKDLAIPTVATADIGRVVTQTLLEGPKGGAGSRRVLELGGPREVSSTEVAAAVSKILGRPIQVVEAPLDAVVPTFTSFGISADVSSLYREMYEGIRNGRVAWDGKGTELARGTVGIEDTLRALLA